MKRKDYEELEPFINSLSPEQAKVIWYIEARKKGNPCITNEEKENALKSTLIDFPKFRLRYPIRIGEKIYTETGNEWI